MDASEYAAGLELAARPRDFNYLSTMCVVPPLGSRLVAVAMEASGAHLLAAAELALSQLAAVIERSGSSPPMSMECVVGIIQ